MEKRLFLAVLFSFLVLLAWSFLFPQPKPVSIVPSPLSVASPVVNAPVPSIPASPPLKFSTPKLEVDFLENYASIKDVTFKDYQNSNFLLHNGLGLKNYINFKRFAVSAQSISFIYTDQEKQITKQFNFSNTQYSIDLQIEIQNLSQAALNVNLPLVLGELDFNAEPQSRYQDFTVSTADKLLHPSPHKDALFNSFNFIGLRDRYFCAIISSSNEKYSGFINKLTAKDAEIGLKSQDISIAPGQKIRENFLIYLGPQQISLINAVKPEWSAIIHFGAFDFIAQVLLQLLEIIHRLVHNWGWAIIVLSLAVYFILYPLTLKQMRSMKEMQVLQPRMEELRKLYKDNPQKLNKEVMELYREHKVNPLGGCLPLILQMPIFFALYQVLARSIVLKGANFFWIKDLSEPDRLFILPNSLPFLGNEINILPLLMMIGMFVQQKISSAATSGVSSEQQKIMLILFPLMFGFIFYHMPSGLVLYWFVNSILMLVYQLKVVKAK